MGDKVYKKIRVTGCSGKSIEKAVEVALAKTEGSVRGSAWFEVTEIRGAITKGAVAEWQVSVDIAFKVD
jgi:flavin-binding protein dodecin